MKLDVSVSRITLSIVYVLSIAALLGCGGTSQDDMRRYAIRRAPDPEDKEPADVNPTASTSNEVANSAEPSTEKAAQIEPDTPTTNTASATPITSTTPTAESLAIDNTVAGSEITQPEFSNDALTPIQRKQQSAEKLQAIGKAWRSYVDAKRKFPWRTDNLSWRVYLLPYLGYDSLFEKFELDESWDSPKNQSLLSKIPAVYQSVDRQDTNTNFLGIDGPQTLFEPAKPMSPTKIRDGAINTLAIVEADYELAVPWTKPRDYGVQYSAPLNGLAELHGDGFFAIWADGNLGWIDSGVAIDELAKAFTTNAMDGFSSSTISYPPTSAWLASAERPQLSAPNAETSISMTTQPTANNASNHLPATSERKSVQELAAEHATQRDEQPSAYGAKVPAGPELKKARDLIKGLYGSDYAAAKSPSERTELARQMLDDLTRLADDLPGQYALLDTAKQIAVQAADVDLAFEATDQLTSRFAVDSGELLDTFEKLARTASDDQAKLSQLVDEAEQVFDELVAAEQYEEAERLSQLATSAANKINDEDLVDLFTTRRHWSSEAKRLSLAVVEGFAVLENHPEDERANGDVGKFLCFIKDDWDNGLVILANGNDRSLKRLAALELNRPEDVVMQLELADLWWKEADSESAAFESTIRSRAKYWYKQALPGLPAGLVRIRVERRIEQLEKQSA